MGAENRFGGVGSPNWPGLLKLMEETAELQQILAKIAASEGTDHWSGDLTPNLLDELGDVSASLMYFKRWNLTQDQRSRTQERASEKYRRFSYWHRVDQNLRDTQDADRDAADAHMGDDMGATILPTRELTE